MSLVFRNGLEYFPRYLISHHSTQERRKMDRATAYLCTGAVLVLLMTLGVGTAVSAQTTIDHLPYVIDHPDTYVLAQDFTNFKGPVAIYVHASNVVINGNGHMIDGVDNPNSFGIRVEPYATNYDLGTPPLRVTVNNIQIQDFNAAVLMYQARNGEITDSTFTSNGDGVVLQIAQRVQVLRNTFTSNSKSAFYVYQGTNNIVDNNNFASNGNGVNIYGSTGTKVRGNELMSNKIGIWLNEYSTTSTVTGNAVGVAAFGEPTKIGIKVQTAGNTIYNNWFNTFRNAVATNVKNTWSTPRARAGPNIVGGAQIGGNAWTMPNGAGFSQYMPDLNLDGFVDNVNSFPTTTATYFINNNNQDFLPLKVAIV